MTELSHQSIKDRRTEHPSTVVPSIVGAATKRSNGREHEEPRRSRELQLATLPVAATYYRTMTIVTLIGLATINTVKGDSCDLTNPISHNEKICNDTKCQLVTSEDIFFSPTQSTVCLQLVSEQNIIFK